MLITWLCMCKARPVLDFGVILQLALVAKGLVQPKLLAIS